MNKLNYYANAFDSIALKPILKVHRVWLITVAIWLGVLGFNTSQGITSAWFVFDALIGTAPYLLLSVILAAYAAATGADSLIGRAFVGSPLSMIFFAAILGGLSPFCSCGVIPLIAALLSMGVPLAGVMAFWLASPVIDPSMFVLTSSLLGIEFAVAKMIAAIGLGLMGGLITLALTQKGFLSNPLREGVGNGGCGAASLHSPNELLWKFWTKRERREKFMAMFLTTTLFLLKWLTLAFLLESLMLAYVPSNWIASALGGTGVVPIVTATIVGVPAYLNGYAALPLVSGMVEQGMTPGAGLAFLVAGGVTSLPAAIAVFALVKRPTFILYLVIAFTGSIVSGLLFEAWL